MGTEELQHTETARPLDDEALAGTSGGASANPTLRYFLDFKCSQGHTWTTEYDRPCWPDENCPVCNELVRCSGHREMLSYG